MSFFIPSTDKNVLYILINVQYVLARIEKTLVPIRFSNEHLSVFPKKGKKSKRSHDEKINKYIFVESELE